jgi:LysR family cyn operon transcriptional activator
VEVAKHLSFTKAAERVHVTQSTLSHQIRQLEDELGTPLFERSDRRVSLSWAGEVFLPTALNALTAIDGGVRSLKGQAKNLTGKLLIGSSQTFNLEVMPRSLKTFLQKHTSVPVSIQESSADVLVGRVADGSLDMAVAYSPFSDSKVDFEPLCSEELVLVTGPNHRLSSRRRVRMVELHGAEMALLNSEFATRQLIDGLLASAGAKPVMMVEAVSLPLLLQLVRISGLCTILSRFTLPQNMGLVLVPLEAPTPVRVSGLIWPSERPRTREMVEFASVLRSVIADLAPNSAKPAPNLDP